MQRTSLLAFTLLLAAFGIGSFAPAADPVPPEKEYLDFVKKQAAELRAGDKAPTSTKAWKSQSAQLRKDLLAAWGGFPEKACPLEPKVLGTLDRDGYRVEKLIFQTRPGVWMTANAYVPNVKGKVPAILMVHGHWKGAKQDPAVQARCIGAVKLGFFVLCVDAFGAGERGVGTALGEYHGDMTAATLLPLGTPLAGLQVYENMRAVDYLQTRAEVDGEKIGITGASGGGNQTMYAGAFDERFKCVVPACSVGNYQAYLGAACCMCEVVPGALKFTEEWGLLALVAPRGLMVISATKDSHQFSVGEAKKSLALATPVFKLLGKAENVQHAIFESPHDYNKAMREAMYGWMTLHLKGEGDGSPIKETEIKTEMPETLRCYPGDTRPKDWITIPKFAAAEGKKLLAAKQPPSSALAWKTVNEKYRSLLLEKSLGGFPKQSHLGLYAESDGQVEEFRFQPEPGLGISGRTTFARAGSPPLAIILRFESPSKDKKPAEDAKLAAAAKAAGWDTMELELRATGARAHPRDNVNRASDHNTAEWGLWIGRPLLGQWVLDVRRTIDARAAERKGDIILIGEGPAGLVALCAAATDRRITKVAAVGTLATFISDEPYVGQKLGTLAPGILRDVGDVPHIAMLASPRRVVIAGGVYGNGKELTPEQLQDAYEPTTQLAKLIEKEKEFVIVEKADAAAVIAAMK